MEGIIDNIITKVQRRDIMHPRRLFFQTKIYDYTSKEEAQKHIKEMESKCWRVKRNDKNEEITTLDSSCDYSYSVEYYKEP